jgi:poly(3-hydroxybutyrate) depolymerase
MLYQAYQFQSDLMSPLRLMAQHLSASLWLRKTERSLLRRMVSRQRGHLAHAAHPCPPAYGITTR